MRKQIGIGSAVLAGILATCMMTACGKTQTDKANANQATGKATAEDVQIANPFVECATIGDFTPKRRKRAVRPFQGKTDVERYIGGYQCNIEGKYFWIYAGNLAGCRVFLFACIYFTCDGRTNPEYFSVMW